MWVGAGAAGSKRGGWAGRSCRRPRGRVEAQQRTGLTKLEEAEPGRRAGWLGGRSATGKRRRKGEGQARAREAERAAPATVWPRGDLGREGRNTRPRAVDAKGCLCPHGRALWSGQQLNRAGTKPWRLSALLPGGGHRRCAGSTAPLLSWGRSVEQLPSQLPLKRQNWLCPWPHPPASVKEEKGPFARGQGHLLPRGLALPHEELQCVSRGAG